MLQPPSDTSDWPQRELQVGSVDDAGVFTPWSDGDTLVLELGFQGAYMLTPFFEVEAEAEDGEEACWFVRVSTGDPERPVVTESGVYPAGLLFERHGERMRAGPLFHVTDESLMGSEERMDIAVFGPDFEATISVTYTLQ